MKQAQFAIIFALMLLFGFVAVAADYSQAETKEEAIEKLRMMGKDISYNGFSNAFTFGAPNILDEINGGSGTDEFYKVLDLYIDAGMNPNEGLSAAIIGWNFQLVKHLVERGASVKSFYRRAEASYLKPSYFSPINSAVERYCDTVRDYGNWTTTTQNGNTVHNLRFLGISDIVLYLIDKGANVNEKAVDRKMIPPYYTPIYKLVSCSGSEKIITYLIKKGALVNYNGKKDTPLVAAYPNYNAMKILIDHGADVNVVKVNVRGEYIPLLALAEKDGRLDIIELLKSHGAKSEVPPELRKKTTKPPKKKQQ